MKEKRVGDVLNLDSTFHVMCLNEERRRCLQFIEEAFGHIVLDALSGRDPGVIEIKFKTKHSKGGLRFTPKERLLKNVKFDPNSINPRSVFASILRRSFGQEDAAYEAYCASCNS